MKLVETCQQITHNIKNNNDRSFLFFKLYDNYIFKESFGIFFSFICVLLCLKSSSIGTKTRISIEIKFKKGNVIAMEKNKNNNICSLSICSLYFFHQNHWEWASLIYTLIERTVQKSHQFSIEKLWEFVTHTHTYIHTP